MALSVAPVQNPNFTGLGSGPQQNISGVISATPGSNGFAGLSQAAPGQPSAANTSASDPSFQNFINSQNALQSQTASLLQQQNALLREQATPAPVLNYQGILANAQAQASNPGSAVNQLYNSQLNNYLQNEGAQQSLAQKQNQLSVQQAQQGLANTQANLSQEQQFTGQQAGLNLGNIGNQQQAYEQNQGIQGEQNLSALRQQLGQSNLGASGLGQQQEFQQNLTRQVQESQQENTFQFQRNSELLSEQNTFANIAQSGKYAQQQESGQEGQANLDLSKFLQQAAYSEQTARQSLAQWQQNAQFAAAQNAAAQQVSQFIQSYKNNPLLYSKAMQAYSGLTGGTAQPELPNLQSVVAWTQQLPQPPA